MTFSPAKAFVAGLKRVPGSDKIEQNQARVASFLDLLWLHNESIDEAEARSLTGELYQWYFGSNSGAFCLSRTLQRELSQRQPLKGKARTLVEVALSEVARLMCRNLEIASQIGHIAGANLETAVWLVGEIASDRMVAKRLMRTCGRGMSGPWVDAFFWKMYHASFAERERFCDPLAEGMLDQEGASDILAARLKRKQRTKAKSDAHVAQFQRERERRIAEQAAFRERRQAAAQTE